MNPPVEEIEPSPNANVSDAPVAGKPGEAPAQTPSGEKPNTPGGNGGEKGGPWTLLIGMLFWIGMILWGVSRNDAGLAFLVHWWWAIAALVLLLAVLTMAGGFKKWFSTAAAEKRTGLVVFVLIPILLMGIGAIVLLPYDYQTIVPRVIFLIAVCLFPALIYYLFIATRQISLLNDYFVNLGRLGLLRRRPSTPETLESARAECRVRLLNYVQKFEALYGPLPMELENSLTQADDPLAVLVTPEWRRTAASGIVKIFTAETAIPVVLATILIALGWLLALPPINPVGGSIDMAQTIEQTIVQTAQTLLGDAFKVEEDPIIYAFLGAYFFSLQMLFRRFVREDLRKSAYLAVSLRIILAVIGTWAAVTALKATGRLDAESKYLPVIGFVIGVFPRIAWQFIQGAAKALMRLLRMSAVLPSLESRLPLSDLDGLTVWHEARLEEEDIENIPNMASAEIVDLMISTRFPPDRIIDWVDQSILFTYLGPDQEGDKEKGQARRELLRLQGIRTATAFMQAFSLSQTKDRKDATDVETILSTASRSHVRTLLDAIRTDSNLNLICAWRGIELPK